MPHKHCYSLCSSREQNEQCTVARHLLAKTKQEIAEEANLPDKVAEALCTATTSLPYFFCLCLLERVGPT